MNFLDSLGTFMIAVVILAGVATALNSGNTASIITAYGDATSGLIKAAKGS